ncbi:hypothetical protein [Parapedobacter lycopersici]|uniref:hypothetical protein n=1 Tax=Parapedobacter lycopersici TaxID=1864939 RepID=UPI00334210AE
MNRAKKITAIPAYGMGILLFAVTSCSSPGSQPAATAPVTAYFSLEQYFKAEAERLQQASPEIKKTVVKSGTEETRNVRIDGWENELRLFSESDINKPAWQQSYRVDSAGSTVTYHSLDPGLRTQEIIVEKQPDGQVRHIRIRNHVENMLYRSEEQLDYYPDSLYRIDKNQHVAIIGDNTYRITGTFPTRK